MIDKLDEYDLQLDGDWGDDDRDVYIKERNLTKLWHKQNEIIDHINRLEKTLRPCTCGDKDD